MHGWDEAVVGWGFRTRIMAFESSLESWKVSWCGACLCVDSFDSSYNTGLDCGSPTCTACLCSIVLLDDKLSDLNESTRCRDSKMHGCSNPSQVCLVGSLYQLPVGLISPHLATLQPGASCWQPAPAVSGWSWDYILIIGQCSLSTQLVRWRIWTSSGLWNSTQCKKSVLLLKYVCSYTVHSCLTCLCPLSFWCARMCVCARVVVVCVCRLMSVSRCSISKLGLWYPWRPAQTQGACQHLPYLGQGTNKAKARYYHVLVKQHVEERYSLSLSPTYAYNYTYTYSLM